MNDKNLRKSNKELDLKYASGRRCPPPGFHEFGQILLDLDERIKNKVESVIKMLREPNLGWVDDFVDDLSNTDNDTDFFIKKYKVYVVFEPPASDFLFINSAAYNSENQIFILRIRNDVDSIIKSKKLEFIREVKDFIVHEDTHKQQDQLNANKQPYCSDLAQLWCFTQYEEIAPFARGIAHALKSRTSLTEDEIIEAIVENKDVLNILSPKDLKAIDAFRKIGGKSLKRFLSKIYQYLYPDPFTLGPLEYRKWLKEHP